MTQGDILEELKHLTNAERLVIMEAAIRLIRADLQPASSLVSPEDKKRQLASAAAALLQDYQSGDDLTAFTALDSEDFCAER
jgi:CHASE3 domain sensor protein